MSKEKQRFKNDVDNEINNFFHYRKTNKKTALSKQEFDKSGVELTPKQNQLYQAAKRNTLNIIQGPAGTAKAQPLYSKILTPNGWVKMGELNIGDYVISNDGYPTKVIGVFPQGEKEIYKISFEDGSSTECCGEHLWYTETYNDKNNRVKKNGKRYSKPLKGTVKNTLELKDTLLTKRGRLNHYIPLTEPVHFNYKDVNIDPYFLGLLLGDGGLSVNNRVTFYSQDDELIEYCNSYTMGDLIKMNYLKGGETDNHKSVSFVIYNNSKENYLVKELKEYKLLGTKSDSKFIPKEYLFNIPNIRIELLKGMMDIDGTINKSSCSYTTVSDQLKEDVCFIINSLGGTFSVVENIPKLNGKECKKAYKITFRLPKEINPFKLKRKYDKYEDILSKRKYEPRRRITSVEKIGSTECQCIMVESDSRLYLTDDFIVTHNTFVACYTALALLANKKVENIIITKPIKESGEQLGLLPGTVDEKVEPFMKSYLSNFEKILGKETLAMLINNNEILIEPLAYMRGSTYDHSVMLLDEAQNCTMKQLMLWVTRLGHGSKAILMGDTSQYDLRKRESGFRDFIDMVNGVDNVMNFEFKNEDIVRNKFLIDITNRYDKYRSERDD